MKKTFTRSLVCVLVLSLLMGSLASLNVSAYDVDAVVIEIGSENEFVSGETVWLSVTPEEDGNYYFCSFGETDTVCTLYDSEFNMLDYSDDSWNGDVNFYLEAYLVAGETYYLMIDTYSADGSEYIVVSDVLQMAEELYIESDDDFSCYVGVPESFYASFEPFESVWESVYWSVDDTDMVSLDSYDMYCDVIFLKAGKTTLRAYTDSGLSCSVEIEGAEISDITLDEEKTVTVSENDEVAYFKFVPEKDGVYSFYSKGDVDVDGTIYDSEFWIINYDYEGGEGLNFLVSAELYEGETYILESVLCSDDEYVEEYTVGITKTPVTKGVTIECMDDVKGTMGDSLVFSALFLPEFAAVEPCIWTVDDESVADVYFEDTECLVTLLGEGKTTLTVTTESGYTDSVEIECLPVPYILLDETVSVTVSEVGYACHKFVPEKDGIYVFFAESEFGTIAELVDSDLNSVETVPGVGIGENFMIQCELSAGEEYYLFSYVAMTEAEEFTYDITVTLATEAEGVKLYDIFFGEDVYENMLLGDMTVLLAAFSPVNAEIEDCVWTVDKEGIVEIQDLSELGAGHYCMIQAVGEGDVKVTVTTKSGLTASVTLTVYGEYLMGDVDGDGNVGGKDSNVLKQYLAGSMDSIHELNADMNMDGAVDAKDSNLLKQYIAGTYNPEI